MRLPSGGSSSVSAQAGKEVTSGVAAGCSSSVPVRFILADYKYKKKCYAFTGSAFTGNDLQAIQWAGHD